MKKTFWKSNANQTLATSANHHSQQLYKLKLETKNTRLRKKVLIIDWTANPASGLA